MELQMDLMIEMDWMIEKELQMDWMIEQDELYNYHQTA